MDWSLRKMKCAQLDRAVMKFRSVSLPNEGWIKNIRLTLGITALQLARRLGVIQQRVSRIEHDEINKKITLATLEKVAEKLECKLVYALVPKTKFYQIIHDAALKKAHEHMQRVSYSMSLEDQKPSAESEKEQLEIIVKELIEKNIKSLWD